MGLRHFLRHRSSVFNRDATDTVDLTADEIYRVLSAERRRVLIRVLDDHDNDRMSVSELARAVAVAESGADSFDVPEESYNTCYVAAYQSHIPVLESVGAVEWDRDKGTVYPAPPIPGLTAIVRDIERVSTD